MIKNVLKKFLYKPGREWLCGLMATLYFLLAKRKFVHVFYDQGVWAHKYKQGTIVDLHINDWLALETYEKNAKDYWFFVYQPKPGDVIIDIGAGKGEDTYCFSKAVGFGGRVLSIEAHPKTFLCLEKFCQYNKLKNVMSMNVAVCETESTVIIDDHTQSPGADIFSTIVQADHGLQVQGQSLDQIVEKLGLIKIDFLKMNIEGAEKMAIRGMGECIKKIKYVCISCHDFLAERNNLEVMRTKNEVTGFLKQNGFRIISRANDARPWIRDQVNGVNENLV